MTSAIETAPYLASRSLATVATEVERRFVLDTPPDGRVLGDGVHIRQGYLADDGEVSVRVRISDEASTLTVKAGLGMARTEVELPLGREEAETLWRHTHGRRIDKVRHRVRVEGGVAEVDVFAGALAGLCIVEVEFGSAAEARRFVPPAWFGAEVTGDARWSNAALARQGLPR